MKSLTKKYDVVVVGGGLAGTCAAIAAARTHAKVALINNRPVLGGNSSSEVRVWVVGATAHGTQRFARETGIIGELFLENQFRNPDGNPYYWDQTVLDLVRAEENLDLFLNTDVRHVTKNLDRITSVTGWTMGSEIETIFEAKAFLDCTGDGLVGHLAGADYKMGRESKSEYGEEWAPEEPDDELLGSSMFFYTKDVGHPTKFIAPDIAIDISQTPILTNRIIRTGDNGCDYWWVEWGGELNTIDDNERIRDELWGLIYGIWDYIKNSGNFDADNLTLEWVGSIPGKRECRRFLGDYVLTQNDILSQKDFEDSVAFGGWSIDLHPVEGVYAEKPGAQQRYSPGTYAIPYRCLYSRNVPNLLFAGRLISASHIAFGSTRVMATCAAMGQAAGTAAALAARLSLTARELGQSHLPLLLQTLARNDAALISSEYKDPDDLALSADIRASSTLTELTTLPLAVEDSVALDTDLAQIIPIEPHLDTITFAVECDQPIAVPIELWRTGKPQNYIPQEQIVSTIATAEPSSGLLTVPLNWHPTRPENAVVVIKATPGVAIKLAAARPYGTLLLQHRGSTDIAFDDKIPDEVGQPLIEWNARKFRRRALAFEVSPSSRAYMPAKLIDGQLRPFGGPHLWSTKLGNINEQIDFTWDHAQEIHHMRVVLNDDVDEDLINLHHHRTPFDIIPEIITDFSIEARIDGIWQQITDVKSNRHRVWEHSLKTLVADGIRMVVHNTAGAPFASVYAINIYGRPLD